MSGAQHDHEDGKDRIPTNHECAAVLFGLPTSELFEDGKGGVCYRYGDVWVHIQTDGSEERLETLKLINGTLGQRSRGLGYLWYGAFVPYVDYLDRTTKPWRAVEYGGMVGNPGTSTCQSGTTREGAEFAKRLFDLFSCEWSVSTDREHLATIGPFLEVVSMGRHGRPERVKWTDEGRRFFFGATQNRDGTERNVYGAFVPDGWFKRPAAHKSRNVERRHGWLVATAALFQSRMSNKFGGSVGMERAIVRSGVSVPKGRLNALADYAYSIAYDRDVTRSKPGNWGTGVSRKVHFVQLTKDRNKLAAQVDTGATVTELPRVPQRRQKRRRSTG